MKKLEKIRVMTRNNTASFQTQIRHNDSTNFPPQFEKQVYNSISICVTAASSIRHNINVIIKRMNSGKIAKDEFFYRTDSIYESLNLIDRNLAKSAKYIMFFQK